MIGTTAAIIMGATAGLHALGAKKQSDASKNAAQTQEKAGRESMELQRQGYQRAEATLAPWIAQGQQGMAMLGDRLGVPRANGTPPAAMPTGAQPRTGPPQRQPPRPVGSGATPGVMAGIGSAMGGSLGAFAPQQQKPMPDQGLVMMRAPNGQTKAVPPEQVAHYESKGAQRV